MKITLLRHAIAEERSPESEARDDERPLTRKGIRQFREAARGIKKLAAPTLVFTSPLVRAQHTAELLQSGLNKRGLTVRILDALRPDRPARLPEELRALPADTEVILVGHSPHLNRLASYLLAGHEELQIELTKGGMISFRLEDPSSGGSAVLECALTQKQLRRIGGK